MPAHERPLRTDHHQVDGVGLAECDHGFVVGDVECDDFCIVRDASIPGRAIQPPYQRAGGDLPRQRVLAAAGSDEKDIHQREVPDRYPACPEARWRRAKSLLKGLT